MSKKTTKQCCEFVPEKRERERGQVQHWQNQLINEKNTFLLVDVIGDKLSTCFH